MTMFWDRVAGVYDLFVNVINRKTHKALRHIVADLIGPEDRVLECACGTGLLTEAIAGRCKALTATDFAPKMLKRAEKNCGAYGNITFRQADITALDEPDGESRFLRLCRRQGRSGFQAAVYGGQLSAVLSGCGL